MKIIRNLSVTGGMGRGPCSHIEPLHAGHGVPEPVEQQLHRLRMLYFEAAGDTIHEALTRLWQDMHTEILERSKRGEFRSAEEGVRRVRDELSALLSRAGNPVLVQRAQDFHALGEEMLRQLSGARRELPQGCVAVADTLSVPEALELIRQKAAAAIVSHLSPLSHAFLLLQGAGFPLAVGANDLSVFSEGKTVLVDGPGGQVILNPKDSTILAPSSCQFMSCSRLPLQITLNCSGSWEKLPQGYPISLVRSEFFVQILGRMPSEEELFSEYASILRGREYVNIRLFDGGADKPVPGLNAPALRGAAQLLAQPEILCLQLRAILRAALHGSARLLIPMTESVQELMHIRELMQKCAAELWAEGLPHCSDLPLGVMIESPRGAEVAEALAACADFGSIGTNDLICTMLNIDRTQPLPKFPGTEVEKIIKHIISAFNAVGKEVCVCGAMAADPVQLELLRKLGVQQISVPSCAIAAIQEAALQV